MSGWRSARLDEIDERDRWIPVRDQLGVGAFGINAWRGPAVGDRVIGEHTEDTTGHEELYLVLEGRATFSVDGDQIDSPEGTFVFVPDPASRRGAVAEEPDTVVLSLGGKPGEAYSVQQWELGWRYNQPAMALYREQRYAEAADVLREGVAELPENSNLHYNLACFAALSGADDEAFEHLRRSIDLDPSFREAAGADSDFDPVRADPRFVELVEAG